MYLSSQCKLSIIKIRAHKVILFHTCVQDIINNSEYLFKSIHYSHSHSHQIFICRMADTYIIIYVQQCQTVWNMKSSTNCTIAIELVCDSSVVHLFLLNKYSAKTDEISNIVRIWNWITKIKNAIWTLLHEWEHWTEQNRCISDGAGAWCHLSGLEIWELVTNETFLIIKRIQLIKVN